MQCQKVDISIIVPFYNGNRYIETLLQTVEQNFLRLWEKDKNIRIELIIVNDSPNIGVDDFSEKSFFPIKIISHKKNEGIHKARITGLEASRGRYIAFLDQDDEWEETFLVSQFEKIGCADVIVANGWIEQSDGKRRLLYKSRMHFKNVLNKTAYIKSYNQITSPGQCLINRNAIPVEWKKSIIKINGSDDLLLWLLMMAKRAKFVINEQILYIHKYTGENLSTEITNMNKSSLSLCSCLESADACSTYELNAFKRARRFRSEIRNRNFLKKIMYVMRNFDLFLPRLWWKIRQGIRRY